MCLGRAKWSEKKNVESNLKVPILSGSRRAYSPLSKCEVNSCKRRDAGTQKEIKKKTVHLSPARSSPVYDP